MDICSLRDKLYGRGVTEAAMRLDADAVRELEQRYQKDWEDNKSYLGIALLTDMFIEQGSFLPAAFHTLPHCGHRRFWRAFCHLARWGSTSPPIDDH